MPFKIRKLPNQNMYRVYNADTGFIHASRTTRANAEKQVRLLHMVERGGMPRRSRAKRLSRSRK